MAIERKRHADYYTTASVSNQHPKVSVLDTAVSIDSNKKHNENGHQKTRVQLSLETTYTSNITETKEIVQRSIHKMNEMSRFTNWINITFLFVQQSLLALF